MNVPSSPYHISIDLYHQPISICLRQYTNVFLGLRSKSEINTLHFQQIVMVPSYTHRTFFYKYFETRTQN